MKKLIYTLLPIIALTICGCSNNIESEVTTTTAETTTAYELETTTETSLIEDIDVDNVETVDVSKVYDLEEKAKTTEDYIYLQQLGITDLVDNYNIWTRYLSGCYCYGVGYSPSIATIDGKDYIQLMIYSDKDITPMENAFYTKLVSSGDENVFLPPYSTISDMKKAAGESFSDSMVEDMFSSGDIIEYDNSIYIIHAGSGIEDVCLTNVTISETSETEIGFTISYQSPYNEIAYDTDYHAVYENERWLLDISDNAEPIAFTNEAAADLIRCNLFMQRFYSGLEYSMPNDEEDIVYINDKEYRPIAIRYSEISSEDLDAINIDFGELHQNKYDKNYYTADVPFQTLEELHSLVEKTHTKKYSQKCFYDIYDVYYYEYNGQMLFAPDISAVFAFNLDYDTVKVTSMSENKATAEINGEYVVTGDKFKYVYDFVFDNGSWKTDSVFTKNYERDEKYSITIQGTDVFSAKAYVFPVNEDNDEYVVQCTIKNLTSDELSVNLTEDFFLCYSSNMDSPTAVAETREITFSPNGIMELLTFKVDKALVGEENEKLICGSCVLEITNSDKYSSYNVLTAEPYTIEREKKDYE